MTWLKVIECGLKVSFREIAGAVMLAIGLSATSAFATELAKPSGPVVLTVTGHIAFPNRGPFDRFNDAFFAYQDAEFTSAAAFDIAMLEHLGMTQISVGRENWPSRYTFEGPLLRDVLHAAGAEGSVARVFALDGYAAEISIERLEKYRVILALKKDGSYLGLGSRGPAWVIFPSDDQPELKDEDDSQWVWGVVRIEIE